MKSVLRENPDFQDPKYLIKNLDRLLPYLTKSAYSSTESKRIIDYGISQSKEDQRTKLQGLYVNFNYKTKEIISPKTITKELYSKQKNKLIKNKAAITQYYSKLTDLDPVLFLILKLTAKSVFSGDTNIFHDETSDKIDQIPKKLGLRKRK
ncbi:MAG: hypothetical protein ACTSYO_05895 [Candidatus Ranarchaeia archaeon]